jgi:malate dehydrogenase (oxaloacetate-decarboxylating)
MSDYKEEAIKLHKQLQGKVGIALKADVVSRDDLSTVYTPGVAAVSSGIADGSLDVRDVTMKGNTIAVVTDGSAVLGLGNIGPAAALPVMEGKAMLFKELGGVNAMPICLNTKSKEETIACVRAIAPGFGGINLEDIAAPDCFAIEDALQDLGIPVFHDDQHATAIVVYAGLINALKVIKKQTPLTIVVNGAGAAGIAIVRLLARAPEQYAINIEDIIVCDSKGIITEQREDLNEIKQDLLQYTNAQNISGTLADAMHDADVFIGVSKGNIVSQDMVKSMKDDPIIFAMANPTPEIAPDLAKKAGAAIVATGRSDYYNQVNNVLAFPGIFKAALKYGYTQITEDMKYRVAYALAHYIKNPGPDSIIPNALDKGVVQAILESLTDLEM